MSSNKQPTEEFELHEGIRLATKDLRNLKPEFITPWASLCLDSLAGVINRNYPNLNIKPENPALLYLLIAYIYLRFTQAHERSFVDMVLNQVLIDVLDKNSIKDRNSLIEIPELARNHAAEKFKLPIRSINVLLSLLEIFDNLNKDQSSSVYKFVGVNFINKLLVILNNVVLNKSLQFHNSVAGQNIIIPESEETAILKLNEDEIKALQQTVGYGYYDQTFAVDFKRTVFPAHITPHPDVALYKLGNYLNNLEQLLPREALTKFELTELEVDLIFQKIISFLMKLNENTKYRYINKIDLFVRKVAPGEGKNELEKQVSLANGDIIALELQAESGLDGKNFYSSVQYIQLAKQGASVAETKIINYTTEKSFEKWLSLVITGFEVEAGNARRAYEIGQFNSK